MKKQIVISPGTNLPVQHKGDLFEQILRYVFETQRYEIVDRVNFTGMEIDLLACHKDRVNEKIYIECKAREKLDSDDIRKFSFNVDFKEVNFGYFISTTEFEHQVAGLIQEMKSKEKYKNIFFWGPDKVIELLESSGRIKRITTSYVGLIATKEILAFTSLGTYYVTVLAKGVLPAFFSITDASTGQYIDSEEIILGLKKIIPEIESLEIKVNKKQSVMPNQEIIDTIAEIHESDYWYDYLPASYKFFVGRQDLRQDIFDFLFQVSKNKTKKRIFYVDGKSGWGKSSLIADLRGRCRNQYYKNKFFTLAIDARSASGNNFVALAFIKLLKLAKKNNFISKKFNLSKIEITSNFDIINSISVKEVLESLERENKILVLVFDQFEDIFRKPGLFKVFYKFLIDINEISSNLVVGFSWKSEINIPIDHEAYHLWQQARGMGLSISMREFNRMEIQGVIKQLEKSLNRSLDSDLKRKLLESSQGFPWLIKKLCIHTWHQLEGGKTMESLVEQDLNCEILFKKDLEELNSEEMKGLKYIAKKSYESDFFDISEIDDKLDNDVINALTNKRLIIRSGNKYNVYWDIFRDYLVTGEMPPIGESYILRQSFTACEIVFEIIKKNNGKLNLSEICKLHPRGTREVTIDNILRDLRYLGVVQKNGDYFYIANDSLFENEGLKNYVKIKLEKYTPYLKLKQSKSVNIDVSEIISTLQNVFVGSSFNEETWSIYARIISGWFSFANLDISKKINIVFSNRIISNEKTFTPQQALESDLELFFNFEKRNYKDNGKGYYDLRSLGLLEYKNKKFGLTEKGKEIFYLDKNKQYESISKLALELYKIKMVYIYLEKNPKATNKDIRDNLPELTENIHSRVYKNKTINLIYKWAIFVKNNLVH